MATLNDYFRSEARDFLVSLERSLQRAPGPDASELHRAVRGLRGTAQMAREQRVFDVISAFESVTRSIADGALAWSDTIAASARDTIADLRALLDATEDEEALDARVGEAAARWRESQSGAAVPRTAPAVDGSTREFREFAAREAAGISDSLDRGIQDLHVDPMDRAPLMSILRRQRALLGSARLEEIPVIADILRAVEDLTRVIVKLDVGVKQEWLDIYRVARDALQTTIAPLLRDELPQSSNSVSRLRHMRAELLERYGSEEETTQPPVDPFAGRTATVPAAPFMAPARPVNSPGADAAPTRATAAPPAASAGPFVPPVASTHSPRVLPTTPVEPSPDEESAASEAVLELGEDAAVNDAVLDLDDEVAAAENVLELDEDAATHGMLDLDEEAVADGGVLDLEADAAVDGDVLDLEADVAVDGGVLDLDEEAVTDEGVLDLTVDAAVEENVHEIEVHAAADAILDLHEGNAVDDATLELGYDDIAGNPEVLELGEAAVVEDAVAAAVTDDPGADEAGPSQARDLDRALELRDVIDRAVGHDPAARSAVDELYSLIRRALG